MGALRRRGGGHLYWAAETGAGLGAIWEANLDGSNPHTIITSQNTPHAVAVSPS